MNYLIPMGILAPMTARDLQNWRNRLNLSNHEAADALCLSLSGFLKQIYGQRPVSKRTARLAETVEQQRQWG